MLDPNNKTVGEMDVVVPKLESGKSGKIAAESLTVFENIYDFKIK